MVFFEKIRSTYAFNPQSWNLYSYVNGNPVNFNDPTGHQGEETNAKLPQSGGDPNAQVEAKEQIKEEQNANQETEENKPPEGANEHLDIINPVTGKRTIEKAEIRNDNFGSGDYNASRKTVASVKHEAIDIKADVGIELVAAVSGTVIKNAYVDETKAGKNLTIETKTDKGTRVIVSMSHLKDLKVKEGDMVKQGEVVAVAGITGNAKGTTPHVHFSIRYGSNKGTPLNPIDVIKNQGF